MEYNAKGRRRWRGPVAVLRDNLGPEIGEDLLVRGFLVFDHQVGRVVDLLGV
ncbi:hypothetical protein ACWEF6_09240 [Amycolatopsis sp. NPDC004772]